MKAYASVKILSSILWYPFHWEFQFKICENVAVNYNNNVHGLPSAIIILATQIHDSLTMLRCNYPYNARINERNNDWPGRGGGEMPIGQFSGWTQYEENCSRTHVFSSMWNTPATQKEQDSGRSHIRSPLLRTLAQTDQSPEHGLKGVG